MGARHWLVKAARARRDARMLRRGIAKLALVLVMTLSLVSGAHARSFTPAGRAPTLAPLAAPALAAAERPPVLGRLRGSGPPVTKWCAAPSGVHFVSCSPSTAGYAGESGSFSFLVVNPTPNDLGFHAVVTCSGMPTSVCKPETSLLYGPADGDMAAVAVD